MNHTISIKVVNKSQEKRFVRFLKDNGLIFADMDGELHVKDGFETININKLLMNSPREMHEYSARPSIRKIFEKKKKKHETAN